MSMKTKAVRSPIPIPSLPAAWLRRMSRVAIAACTLSVLASPAVPARADECAAHYERLYDRHAQFVQGLTDRTSEKYFKDAVDLEGAVFEAMDRCPGDPLLLSLMAELQLDLGRFSLAAQYGRKAVSAGPLLWQPHHVLGSAMSMVGRHDQGIGELKEAARLAPGNPRVLFNLASALVWADRPGEAAPMLDALTKSDCRKTAAAAYFLRGRLQLAQGNARQARGDFAEAHRLGFSAARDLLQIEQGDLPGEPAGE